jgi:hypothetical protein
MQNCNGQINSVRLVNGDQEVWVKNRLETLIEMARGIYSYRLVAADEVLAKGAISGLIEGAAIEIIHTLGMEPSYANLKDLRKELPQRWSP